MRPSSGAVRVRAELHDAQHPTPKPTMTILSESFLNATRQALGLPATAVPRGRTGRRIDAAAARRAAAQAAPFVGAWSLGASPSPASSGLQPKLSLKVA